MKISTLLILVFFVSIAYGQTNKNLAPTPPMGWNSWNWFGKDEINEQNMKDCMDAIVQEGLFEAGYEYFIVDGGWRDIKLGSNGELLAHPEKFPNGMKALADYAHSKGLKFGLHTVPGTHDCGGDPIGGFGHEEVHVQQFADWGLDFIKLDKCKYADGWNDELVKQTYFKWRSLLDDCGRNIVLSISAYEWLDWYPQVGQMARTTDDITAKCNTPGGALFDPPADFKKEFLSVMEVAEINSKSAEFAGNGYWNDPDMLVTGNQGLSIEEQKAHFALWCIMSSPLILGNDPRLITKEEKNIIMNELAISINQDPTEQGRRIAVDAGFEIWKKDLKNGEKAILVLNRLHHEKQRITLNLKDYDLTANNKIINVYTGEIICDRKGKINFEVEPHSGTFLVSVD